MPATIHHLPVKTPEPVDADQWALYLRIARSAYPELPPEAFLAGRQEVITALASRDTG